MYVINQGFASNDGVPTIDDEGFRSRMIPIYDGITAPTEGAMTKTQTTMNFVAMGSTEQYGFEIGDYLQVDDEIVRVKNKITTVATGVGTIPKAYLDTLGPLTVYRACLGTKAATHINASLVRKIKPLPVELRRHSINRVAGHTFEYVGFGPGNYSTALPEKQDRTISDTEEIIGQSIRKNGGINYFTGMNDKGIFYSGNKKLNSVTGKEEVFNTPIRSVTGEDISVKKGINLVKATEGDFSQSIKIDGGDQGKAISEFKGPVVFSNKVTSSSTKGLEATSLFLQGESTVSRKYTVGIATPTDAGTPGDITFKENPEGGKYLGWVYTTDKAWKRFGSISTEANYDYHIVDRLSVGTGATINSNGNATFSGIVTAATASINTFVGVSSAGVGTASPRATLDLAEGVGINTFMILPKVTSTVGLGTTAGALMFNTTTNKFQGFTGTVWVDLH